MAIQAQLYSENLEFPFGGYEISSQDWMGNTCGFNDLYLFDLQQQQQQPAQQKQQYQQLQQQQLQRNQDLCFENGFFTTKNNDNTTNPPMSISIATQIQKQNQEIDRFIALQNERLRLALQEHRKQQLMTFLRTYELKSQILLRQKDEEIAKFSNRRMELEELLRTTEMERQTWQKVAKENEIMAINLNRKLEQLKNNCCFGMNGEAEDAESCCETDENRKTNDGEEENKNMICKGCFSGESCVVFLPCRHLCSCKSCDAFLESCPVCRMVKKASIEVLI